MRGHAEVVLAGPNKAQTRSGQRCAHQELSETCRIEAKRKFGQSQKLPSAIYSFKTNKKSECQ